MLDRFRLINRFRDDDAGIVSVEFVFAAIWLSLWYVATFVFFDAYRQYNTATKAAYTIGDLVSRQENVDAAYLDGLANMYGYLIKWRSRSDIRYTSLYWDESDDRYEVDWSHPVGDLPELVTADLVDFEDRLPTLVDGEHIILVETQSLFNAVFNVGITQNLRFENFVVTSPRFAARVVFSG